MLDGELQAVDDLEEVAQQRLVGKPNALALLSLEALLEVFTVGNRAEVAVEIRRGFLRFATDVFFELGDPLCSRQRRGRLRRLRAPCYPLSALPLSSTPPGPGSARASSLRFYFSLS